jgi:hypothetical protein
MTLITAADAVSPAIQRTREFLFRPFSWGTYLKLGLVAMITEGLGSNSHSNTSHGGHPSGHGPMIHSMSDIPAGWVAAAVAAILLAIVISLFVAYLITRLRFAFFHCLVHNIKEIRPGWHLYREQAMRFFWLNVVVGVCFLLVAAVVALPFIAGFLRLFHETQQGGPLDVGLLVSLVLPLIPVILLLAVAGIATDLILRDCMLPHFALESATAGEAWTQVWARIKAEKRQFLAYALLRIVLPTIAAIAMFILLMIPGAALAGAFAAIFYGVHSAFAGAAGGAMVAGIAVQAFFGMLAFVFVLLLSICLGGPIATATREFALIFYGSRYPVLGNALYPPAPPLAA